MGWLFLVLGCQSPVVVDSEADSEVVDCESGTDPWDCGEPDTDATEPDTEWDTEPLPDEPDIDVDTEVCEPSGRPEQVQYGPETFPNEFAWCVMPQTWCSTWSQQHARSVDECVWSARVSGCEATYMSETWWGLDEYQDYFDADGVLIASRHSTDYNLDCEADVDGDSDTGEWTSSFETWRGGRIQGCQTVQSAYSAPCLPSRGIAWHAPTQTGRPPIGPATLEQARAGFGDGCFGEASCGPGRGTLIVAPAFDTAWTEERFEYWYYNDSGALTASLSDVRTGGATPGRCQGAVVQRMGSCGFIAE